MQILTTAIIKGGTGKSTTAAALAQAAVYADKRRVLLIDLDPQANLSYFTGANVTAPGCYELITGGKDPGELIQSTAQGIDIITANRNLAAIKSSAGSSYRLKEAIEPILHRYDLIIIDTPPTMGEMTYNALNACTGLIIPLEADNSSLQGLYQIVSIVRQMQRNGASLIFKGQLITRYDNRPKVNRYMLDTIQKAGEAEGVPFLGTIRPGIVIREAQGFHESLFDYAPKSKPAADYMAIYEAIKDQ